MNGIGVWLSEGSGWTIERIDGHYINFEPTYKGSSHILLPVEFQHHTKGLVNIKNEDNECFRWCHARFLNPQEKDPQRIKKLGRNVVLDLDYAGVEFPVSAKHCGKIEEQHSINVNVFRYEDKQFYPIYVSKECNEDVLNLLEITEGEKNHYVLIKDFNRLMYNKTRHKERKHFCMHCLQCFSTEEILHNNNLIFILRKIHVNMIKCTLHESKLSTLISYPK